MFLISFLFSFCLIVMSGKLGLSPPSNLSNLSKTSFFPSAVEKEKEKEKPEEDENFPSRRSKRMKS